MVDSNFIILNSKKKQVPGISAYMLIQLVSAYILYFAALRQRPKSFKKNYIKMKFKLIFHILLLEI